MKNDTYKNSIRVTGPGGSVLTPANLPPPDIKRWSARRKAEVVAAVHGGLLTMAQACHRYTVSHEEFTEWERHYKAGGLDGLRAYAKPVRPIHPIH